MPLDEFVRDLLNPDLWFLAKALIITAVASVVCGVVGCHVVLRGMAFIGDAVAHAVFPGVAVAFVVQASLLVGGAVAGVLTSVAVAVLSQNRRLREDSVIGVLLVSSFALGLLVVSRAPGYAGSLERFLFGSITGIPDGDVVTVTATAAVVLGAAAFLHRHLVAVAMDREMARATGLPVLALDVALYVGVTLAVVISLRTIGNILVLALLVTPAATARLVTDRLGVMMATSAALGATASLVGIYLSWSHDVPVGATIVLLLTGCFLVVWSVATVRGRRRSPSVGAVTAG